MKDNEVIDFGFVLKSLLKNWIIGLVIFIIVIFSYYTFTVNLKKRLYIQGKHCRAR